MSSLKTGLEYGWWQRETFRGFVALGLSMIILFSLFWLILMGVI